jgi:hypothetical protein
MPIIIDGAISLGPGISVNYVTPPAAGWNIAQSSYLRTLTLTTNSEFQSARKVHFKPDGTKMYVAGIYRSMVEYTLSTPWNISTATRTAYRTGFGDASPIFSEPYSINLSSDGTKLYHLVPNGSNAIIYQAPLSTAWDLSTLPGRYDPYGIAGSPGPISYTISSGVVNGGSIMEFSNDGTMLFVVGSYATARVDKFSLGTAWDVTTLSYVGNAVPVIPTSLTISGISFKTDGTKMYLLINNGTSLREYNLSTAWDITTSTFIQSSTVSSSNDIHFRQDGGGFYLVTTSGAGTVLQYDIPL